MLKSAKLKKALDKICDFQETKVKLKEDGQDEASPLEDGPVSSSSVIEQKEGGETEPRKRHEKSNKLYMYNNEKFLNILQNKFLKIYNHFVGNIQTNS